MSTNNKNSIKTIKLLQLLEIDKKRKRWKTIRLILSKKKMKQAIFIFLLEIIFLTFTSSTCPPGTIESLTNKTICYLFSSEKEKFMKAEENCVQHGGHLASVHSIFDNSFISGMILHFIDFA